MVEVIRSVLAMRARADPVLKRLADVASPVVVEVGVSGAIMAEHMLRTRPDLTWHGVDNWAPQELQPEAYRATRDVHALRTKRQQDELAEFAINRVRPFGARATVHRMASVEAAELFEPGSVDLCFLDADHSYPGVRADIEAWWPKVRSGSWLSGHDIDNRYPGYAFEGVRLAVDEFVAREGVGLEIDTGYTWFARRP